MLEENETIRQARREETAQWSAEERQRAMSEMEEYLAGRVPEQLASRVLPLPALFHVWTCFWELDSERPVSSMPVGLGGSIPVREAIPWRSVGAWLDERGIDDPQERHVIRQLIRRMDGEYRTHQSESLKSATEAGGDDDG